MIFSNKLFEKSFDVTVKRATLNDADIVVSGYTGSYDGESHDAVKVEGIQEEVPF